MDKLMFENPWKYELAIKTNAEHRKGGIREAMKGADVVIAASRPGPGIIKKEWIEEMNKDPVVFALANPVPEIWPWEAREAGARIIATGRSDFPNQINNSLVFPAMFRGVLSVRAKAITDEMIITFAETLARYAEKRGLGEEYIIPTMEEWDAYIETAVAVGVRAMELGISRITVSREELLNDVRETILSSRAKYEALMKAGYIRSWW
jgi:malate dehydrogenase (oxaloacetate-decarboxylating)